MKNASLILSALEGGGGGGGGRGGGFRACNLRSGASFSFLLFLFLRG